MNIKIQYTKIHIQRHVFMEKSATKEKYLGRFLKMFNSSKPDKERKIPEIAYILNNKGFYF